MNAFTYSTLVLRNGRKYLVSGSRGCRKEVGNVTKQR